jgi:hypothetical protein
VRSLLRARGPRPLPAAQIVSGVRSQMAFLALASLGFVAVGFHADAG